MIRKQSHGSVALFFFVRCKENSTQMLDYLKSGMINLEYCLIIRKKD